FPCGCGITDLLACCPSGGRLASLQTLPFSFLSLSLNFPPASKLPVTGQS
ncbi:hypothetical protein STEG23_014494, partial [Scotinomys teguina]